MIIHVVTKDRYGRRTALCEAELHLGEPQDFPDGNGYVSHPSEYAAATCEVCRASLAAKAGR